MSLFTKGNWTRLGVPADDALEALRKHFDNPRQTFMSSALIARSLLIGNSELDTSVGINPPCWPCGDAPVPLEQITLDRMLHPVLLRQLADESNEEPWLLPDAVDNALMDENVMFGATDRYWGNSLDRFTLLDAEAPVYGFWVVFFKRETLDDLKALKEHGAATSNGQPLNTLASSQKTDITKALESDGLVDYISRKQFPVIMDLRTGDIWAGTTTKGLLEAFRFWMTRWFQIAPERMTLTMGGASDFAQQALNVFRDKDLYALERQEAYEQAQKDNAADAEEVEEAEEAPETPVVQTEVPEGFVINDIATYAPGDGTMVVSVETDALITLGVKGRAAVSAHHPLDALALLKEIPEAGLATAKLVIKENVGEGIAKVSVEASALLADATYKGLDLDFQSGCNAELEQGLDTGIFGEYQTAVERVNQWWFRYYLRLQQAERMIITAMATALEFEDIEAIRPKTRSLMVSEVQLTHGEVDTVAGATENLGGGNAPAVRRAAKQMKDALKENLLPGETVTVTTSKGTVGVQASEVEV